MTDPTETARHLLDRHGLPEDVIDGALALHIQEVTALVRAEADRPRQLIESAMARNVRRIRYRQVADLIEAAALGGPVPAAPAGVAPAADQTEPVCKSEQGCHRVVPCDPGCGTRDLLAEAADAEAQDCLGEAEADAERQLAAVQRVRHVLEMEPVLHRSALEYRGLVLAALMADEAQQQPDTETPASPPTVRWRLQILDGVWASSGPRYSDRATAVARYRHDSEKWPTWSDPDRTPVQRRIVRETTTYTVEQPAVADTGEEADRIVGYRSKGGRLLRCVAHHPGQESLDSGDFHAVTSEDLPDGGLCTYPVSIDARCGVDVLIPQEPTP